MIYSKYPLKVLQEVAPFPPIQNTANPYLTEAAMHADQANQLEGYGYLVDGVGAFTYLGTVAGTAADYVPFGGKTVFSASDSKPFISTWNVIAGTAVYLPLGDGSYTNIIKIDWGDGVLESNNTSDAQHTYSTSGSYDIKIYGTLNYFKSSGTGYVSRSLITAIVQWGDIEWVNFGLSECSNFATLPIGETPNFLKVTELWETFRRSKLTSVPVGLFDKAINCVEFIRTFKFSNDLVTVPSTLFKNCISAKLMNDCFFETKVVPVAGMLDGLFSVITVRGMFRQDTAVATIDKIDTIPIGFFDQLIHLEDVSFVFFGQNITSLDLEVFKYNPQISDFSESFRHCPIIGRVPELWMRYPDAPAALAFQAATGADNYAVIPTAWSGTYTGGYGKMLSAYLWTGSQVDLDAQSLSFRNDTNILKFVV